VPDHKGENILMKSTPLTGSGANTGGNDTDAGRIKISAIVLVYNEEKQIRDCLETIKWVDEIVICDSYSTDKTIEICREYTDKIYQRKFDNFGNQKSWTLDKPSHEWVLYVEADERFSPELRDEIKGKLAMNEEYDGYWMPFDNYFFGKKMKGSHWEFKKLKLYKKNKGKWQKRKVHAGFIFEGRAGELKNPVLHYPYQNFRHWFRKFNYSTTLEAEEMMENNVRVRWYHIIKGIGFIPVNFYRCYLKPGDPVYEGLMGFIFSILNSPFQLIIYSKYWVKKLNNRYI
jgi:glycosyltransferase involved in cell wall biosynthesis